MLNVPVSFFFDDMPPGIIGEAVGLREETVPFDDDVLTKRESLNLVRHYYRLPNDRIRKHVRDLLAELARSDSDYLGNISPADFEERSTGSFETVR